MDNKRHKVSYPYNGYVWPRIVTASSKEEAIEKAQVPVYDENVTVRLIGDAQ